MTLKQFSLLGLLLTAMFWVWPASAQVTVCSHSRPNWDSDLGDATWVTEMLHILSSSGVLALFVVMILAIKFQNLWFSLVVTLAGLLASYFFYNAWTVSDPKSVMFRSIVEGCVGPPYGAIAFILGAAIIVVGSQFFGRTRGATS